MKYVVMRRSKYAGSSYDEDNYPCSEDPPCLGATVLRPSGLPDEDRPSFIWTIEINSIDELTSFIERNGKVVINKREEKWSNPNTHDLVDFPILEIYDHYRE